MRILLTGATGFTGFFFRSVAEIEEHQVVGLHADLTDKTAVAAEVLQTMPDAVVHLGAISNVAHADDRAFYDVNVLGTINLLTALAALPIRPSKVLLASSANIYGNCDVSPITETQSAAPMNHYAMSKLAMEHMSWTFIDRLPLVMVRPFNYTGPKQSQHFLIPKLTRHFARRSSFIELGNLDVAREFNDVRMVCDAYLALLTHGLPGEVYNVCSGQPYSLLNVIDLLTDITGHEMRVLVNPTLVRASEVSNLCGSATKLQACIGQLKQFSLKQTLSWMLERENVV